MLRNAGNLSARIGAIIVIAIIAVIAQGQAPAPILDGFGNGVTTFGGPCCAPGAMPNLPLPPLPATEADKIQLPMALGCLINCGMEQIWVGATTFVARRGDSIVQSPAAACDEAIFTLETRVEAVNMLAPATPNSANWLPMSRIDLRGKYTETWTLEDAEEPNETIQVWRYIVHGNMVYDPIFATAVPCPVPQGAVKGTNFPGGTDEAFAFPPYWGHVDLLRRQTQKSGEGKGEPVITEEWEVAVALTHHVGCVTHSDVIAVNGQALPPSDPVRTVADDRQYHLVAPVNHAIFPYFDFGGFYFKVPTPKTCEVAMSVFNDDCSVNEGPRAGTYRTTISSLNTRCLFENDSLLTVEVAEDFTCFCASSLNPGANPANPGLPPGLPMYYESVLSNLDRNEVYCTLPGQMTLSSFPWSSINQSTPRKGFTQLYVGGFLDGTPALLNQMPTADWLIGQQVLHNFDTINHTDICYNNVIPGASPPSDFHIVHGVTTRPSDNMATDYRVATIFDQASTVHSLAGTVLQQMVNSVGRFSRTLPGGIVLPVDFPLVPSSDVVEVYPTPAGTFRISSSQATIGWSNWR